MTDAVLIKTYAPPPVDEREILRYAGVRGEADEHTRELLSSCLEEAKDAFSYRVCYCTLPVSRWEEFFGKDGDCALAQKRLSGATYFVAFAATVGLEIDRLLLKNGISSPSKAAMLQAVGAERIESLCNAFCEELADTWNEKGLRIGARFSAGYGDFPLSAQTRLFARLDCQRKIGLTLSDTLMMTPTKSVTAIVPIYARACVHTSDGCESCDKADCDYKK